MADANSSVPQAKADPRDWLQNLGIAIEVIFPVLALIVTVLRVYIRLKIKGFGWDDACMILAMVLSIAMAVGSVYCMKLLYIGIHYWDAPHYETLPETFAALEPGLIWTYAVGAIYNPILAIVKQSILIFLLRLGGTKPGVRTVVWVTAFFNAALMIAVFLVVIFQCKPISRNWKPMSPGSCINQSHFGISTACLTILTDLIALALPFYIFLDLKIAKRTKIALLFVFGLGLLVTAISVVRLYYLWEHLQQAADPITYPDSNYSLGFCVSAIEVNLAIITASGPALWPLVRSWAPHVFSRLGVSNGYQQNNNDVEYNNSHGAPGVAQKRRTTPSARAGPGGGTLAGTNGGGSKHGLSSVVTSHIGLKEMRGDKARGRVEIESNWHDSDEELTPQGNGILRSTEYTVTRDDRSGTAGSPRLPDSAYGAESVRKSSLDSRSY